MYHFLMRNILYLNLFSQLKVAGLVFLNHYIANSVSEKSQYHNISDDIP
jgi:hypothetical protein